MTQQHAREEDQRQAEDVQSVECPVVTEVGKAHAEDHGHDVADGDECALMVILKNVFHLQQAGDHVGLDGDNCHGNRVVQDDDASLALGLDDVHAEQFDDHLAHAHLSHRA